MDMRDLLLQVAASYDREAGTKGHVPGQRLLRRVQKHGGLALPEGYIAKGRGGQGSAAATPWIGVFHRDITEDPTDGLYLAYIFSADLESVTLTLQQGVTRLEAKLGGGQVLRRHLERKAAQIRAGLPTRSVQGCWAHQPRFGSTADGPRAYQAGSVAARHYSVAELPVESDLQADLSHAMGLLQEAASVERRAWHEEGRSLLNAGYEGGGHGMVDPLSTFHPKDSRSYIAKIAAKQQVKNRHHERLIADFGPYIFTRGYIPRTDRVHPKDLVLHAVDTEPGNGAEWLVEAKAVRSGNATAAVREAVGQLKEYSYFLYQERDLATPHLVALFTEDIGVYSKYLETQGIAAIWQTDAGWQGSPLATAWSMVE
ncbi:MrcB family domain-containing protein [Streptomyces jumonjinensis]|uniref:MrcB family domain-containing protein n=1 Tax=Streptomyces jumonjinensis TaxID=1945 RepID=UPI0037B9A1DA